MKWSHDFFCGGGNYNLFCHGSGSVGGGGSGGDVVLVVVRQAKTGGGVVFRRSGLECFF